jgi:hypothetical protein
MATKKTQTKAEEPGTQGIHFESTRMYRVYVSADITVTGKDGDRLKMKLPVKGLPKTGQIEMKVTPPDLIVAREGFDPEGNRAIFLVRVPKENQIFKPE